MEIAVPKVQHLLPWGGLEYDFYKYMYTYIYVYICIYMCVCVYTHPVVTSNNTRCLSFARKNTDRDGCEIGDDWEFPSPIGTYSAGSLTSC